MTETTKKAPLDLTPNEIIGYRLTPEPHNWTISVIKQRPNGKQYKTPLSYHKNLTSSVSWIYNHVAQTEGANLQKEHEKKTGQVGEMSVLPIAFNKGLNAALDAVDALEKDLLKNGVPLQKLASTLSKVLREEHLKNS